MIDQSKKKSIQLVPRKGFTLIEIMIALSIIALILAVVVPVAQNQLKQANVRSTRIAIKNVQFAIQQYQMDTGVYPAQLKDLIKRPADDRVSAKWTGPYLPDKTEPRDSWNNKFQYKAVEGGKHPFELKSFGPSGKGSAKEDQVDVWLLD